ncbi:sigma-54 interaction domain-containing protein [Metabacillus herbersteinensis]|uniref:Sigma-54 interaction domain-containing protein n=1 Tax=Metabacillus herbersteinensis TaxID=283816 RepID=A0ABV6GL08_9BACI
MTKQTLVLVCGTNETKHALTNQLYLLIGDYVTITSYTIGEDFFSTANDSDTFLFSSKGVYDEVKNKYPALTKIIIANRTLNYENIDQILLIPENSSVLVVNDTVETTLELIEALQHLGIDHLNYTPFSEKKWFYETVDIAISPGEMDLIPSYVQNKMNIGVRLLDISTVFYLVKLFKLEEISAIISQKYLRSLVNLNRKLLNSEKDAIKLGMHLQHVVNSVDDGVLAVREDGIITVFNDKLAQLFNVQGDKVLGGSLNEALGDGGLIKFILEDEEKTQFFTIDNLDLIVYKYHSLQQKTTVVTVKTLRDTMEMEKSARKKQNQNGFVAKYDFNDIVGEDSTITEAILVAKKLSRSHLPVLIEGATGTGKELFAHSIHQHSERKNAPFVAVNCSALSDSLLESELFGYEEGTFTDAQKGGKKGLFELADGGTIFLDEIGDLHPTLQSKLLRVLQENEIRRIGGSKIISINVRVISATNQILENQLAEGTFRPDLFYRLNVLSLRLSELQNRKSDIPLLITHFIKESGKLFRVDGAVVDALTDYDWPGNIRELKNTLDYMITVCDGRSLQLHDIPKDRIQKVKVKKKQTNSEPIQLTLMDKQEYMFILGEIKQSNEKGEPASRRMIADNSKVLPIPLTTQQVRHRLDFLEKHLYITKGRGRAGTKITLEGIDFLISLKENLKSI